MMDFVYPLGSGSLHKDSEIGYSMRSVRKFVADAGDFVVIGQIPKTPPGPHFTTIAADDNHAHKNINAMEKMRIACKNPHISDPFIWMNDDFFFCRSILAGSIQAYHAGSLALHIAHREHAPNNYTRALIETRRQLVERGLPTLDFEIHVPFPVRKREMLNALEHFEWRAGASPLLRSCYANYLSLSGNTLDDCKFDSPITREEIIRRLGHRSFFSAGDGGLLRQSALPAFLDELAPA